MCEGTANSLNPSRSDFDESDRRRQQRRQKKWRSSIYKIKNQEEEQKKDTMMKYHISAMTQDESGKLGNRAGPVRTT
jgi:hypothetical protein